MRWKVFNFIAAVSLVLCLATVAALVVSYIGDGNTSGVCPECGTPIARKTKVKVKG